MARVVRTPLAFQFTGVGTKVKRLFRPDLEQVLEAYARDFVDSVTSEVKAYPPQNPESTYERTFTLFNSWSVHRFTTAGGGIGYRSENDATDPRGRLYARYAHGPGVQPAGFQSRRMRSLGWRNVSDFTRRQEFRDGIQRIISASAEF